MKPEYDFSKGERGRFYLGESKPDLPPADEKPDWIGPAGRVGQFVAGLAANTLESYRARPALVTEHADSEDETARGGAADRLLLHLVRNSAGALLDAPKGQSILVRLTENCLYCADDGSPIDEDGLAGLALARMSNARDAPAIGRFGSGFESTLRVSDAPEFYSRPASLRFDRKHAEDRISKVAPAKRYPALRLPEPIDPRPAMNTDENLREFMSWATNIVRLPLRRGARGDLARQIRDFPPELMSPAGRVRYLTFEDGEFSRSYVLRESTGALCLDTDESAYRPTVRSRGRTARTVRDRRPSTHPGPHFS